MTTRTIIRLGDHSLAGGAVALMDRLGRGGHVNVWVRGHVSKCHGHGGSDRMSILGVAFARWPEVLES